MLEGEGGGGGRGTGEGSLETGDTCKIVNLGSFCLKLVVPFGGPLAGNRVNVHCILSTCLNKSSHGRHCDVTK